jgi:CheY-like chemotaxis protein
MGSVTTKADCMKVLVVEPDGLTGMTFATLLNATPGYEAQWAKNESQAATLIARHAFDIVLCENRLKCGSGETLAKHLAQRGLAVVLTTTADTSCLPPLPWAAGCFEKPFDSHDLLQGLDVVRRIRQGLPPGKIPPNFRLFAKPATP